MTGSTRTRAKDFLLSIAAVAAIAIFGPACGSDKSGSEQSKGTGADRRANRLDRGGQQGDESTESRFEVLSASASNTRPSAGTANDQAGGGSGGRADNARPIDEAEAARRRENRARCDRLVEHYVSLTGKRMGKGASGEALDKLEGQTDALRETCNSGAWLTPDYERCALAAETLDEAIACSAKMGPHAAKAFEQAHELSTRKDLLEKAEKKIEAGDVPKPEVDVRPDHSQY